jgi:phospholipid N-methyltransferase
MSEATLRLTNVADDEETVTVAEMGKALGDLDETLSVIQEFTTQLAARGYSHDWFDALVDLYNDANFQREFYFWRGQAKEQGEASAPDLEVDAQDAENEDDEAGE